MSTVIRIACICGARSNMRSSCRRHTWWGHWAANPHAGMTAHARPRCSVISMDANTMRKNTAMPKILTFDELRGNGVGCCPRQLYRLEQCGKFPKRVKLGTKRVGWLQHEIERYVKEQIKASRGDEGDDEANKKEGQLYPPPFG